MDTSSTNGHGTKNTSIHHQDSDQTHLTTQEDKAEIEHVNKKPIKRIVPEKIAEVGQWKAAREDKVVNEEDKAVTEEDKAVNEENKADMSTEDAKTN
ncbi:hypothetical protein KCU77_g7328, partial [Aureobasidium melanogenum]